MRRLLTPLAALALLVPVAACGGDDSGDSGGGGGGGGGEQEVQQLRVGVIPIVDVAPIYLGVEQGFFEEQGLDVTVDVSAGGAAAVPGLMSGGLQLAGSNTVSALLAVEKGLPITMVAPGTFGSETEGEDFSAVLVAENSDIREPADLAGSTIAVNTLENIGDVTISAALEEHGVDPAGVEFVEIGFPDMIPALERGQIDAAWEIEPFVTIGAESGARPVLWPYVEARPGLMVGSYLATQEYREQNPEVIEAFRNGLEATAASVAEDPDAFRTALPDLARVTPEVAGSMTLPQWKSEIDVESLEFIEEQMREHGLISEPVDVGAVVAD